MRESVDDARREAVRRLSGEFQGIFSPFTITAEVVAAESELRGRVPGASLGEMLHRVAAQRLRELCGGGR